MLYIFTIGDEPEVACNITLDGLISASDATEIHYKKLAELHAKMLWWMTEKTVRYYPKGEPDKARFIDRKYEETEDSKGGAVPGDGQKKSNLS